MPAKIQRKIPVKKLTPSAEEQMKPQQFVVGRKQKVRRVRPRVLTQFTTQLATLQNAGLPIVKCLRILEGQMHAGPLKETLAQVIEDVESGSSLSEAFAKHPGIFDRLYVNMVRAGEAGGVLDTILNRLAEFSEKAEDIKSKIKNALAYPVFVLMFAALIVTFIMIVIVPKFTAIFEEFRIDLPAPTRVLINLSYFMAKYWYVIVAAPIVLYIAFRLAVRNAGVRFQVDRAKLAIPITGGLLEKTIIARFSRTLGTLLQSGVPILDALAILKGAVTNAVLERAVDSVHESIREGDPISRPLGESKIFDDMVVNMVDVGEKTGELDKMLLKIADVYDRDVDSRVTAMFKIIEPVILLLLAVVVGFIVISLFLPILKIMDTFAERGV
jgi:type IV pilus assembly protein PilC